MSLQQELEKWLAERALVIPHEKVVEIARELHTSELVVAAVEGAVRQVLLQQLQHIIGG